MKTTKRKWIAAGLIAAGAFFTGLQVQAAQIAYWSFDNPDNLGKDSVGSRNFIAYSTNNLPVYDANGKSGGAARFDDNSAWTTSRDFFHAGSFTFAAFVKPDDTNVTTLATTRNRDGGFDIWMAGDKWRSRVWADGKYTYRIGDPVTTDWTHIAIRFEASGAPVNGVYTGQFKIFMNGVEVASIGADYAARDSDDLAILLGSSNFTPKYRGLVDEMQMHDTALSDEEIFKLANPPAVALYILSN